MIATNHALCGALIGMTLATPWALPLAFGSHFILDGLPHFGFSNNKYRGRVFKIILITDIIGCLVIAALLFNFQPQSWFLALLCAFIATSADIMWAPGYFRGSNKLPSYKLARFHAWVQWSETPMGMISEIIFFLLLASTLAINIFLV